MPETIRKAFDPLSNQLGNRYPKTHILRAIPLKDIVPSPFQRRTNFDPDKLKDPAKSIMIVGLIYPILVRPVGARPACQKNACTSGNRAQARRAGKYLELIAGERRSRAIRHCTDMQTIEAKIIETDDIGARRLSAAENIQREDLTAFEIIEAIVELIDSELADDPEYIVMAHASVDRVKTLLGTLDAVRRSKLGGYQVANAAKMTSHKLVGSVEQIFQNLPKPLKWRSFYVHDLELLVQADQTVRKASIQNKLTKSQTWSLVKLNKASKSQFETLVAESTTQENENLTDRPSPRKRELRDLKLYAASFDCREFCGFVFVRLPCSTH